MLRIVSVGPWEPTVSGWTPQRIPVVPVVAPVTTSSGGSTTSGGGGSTTNTPSYTSSKFRFVI